MPHLTAEQLKAHPEYPHVFWDLPCTTSSVACGAGRGGPYDIAYDLHGDDAPSKRRILFIGGLGMLRGAWQRQSKDFGHTRSDQYSVLVFDNRGIGDSGKPFMRYSTSSMAQDTLELLDHVGWTEKRSVHIVGISMGGMIAQELAMLDPERLATLTLVSTAARLVNTIGFFENLRNRINMFAPKSLDDQIDQSMQMLYTKSYTESPDPTEHTVEPFPTGGDRFGAQELWKRSRPDAFPRTGFIAQALAAGWHNKSAEQLKQLADKVGRDRMQVMHGTEDQMITIPHAEVLAEELSRGGGEGKGVKRVIFEGQAHGIPIEKREEFHKLVEELIEKSEALG